MVAILPRPLTGQPIRHLPSFAKADPLDELAFRKVTRGRNACAGASYRCTDVSQSPYEFNKIFSSCPG